MYEDFEAMAQGACDYRVAVIETSTEEFGSMMTICATEEAVYITKEQAMKFFGLVEAG
jgi:hypothetical protein